MAIHHLFIKKDIIEPADDPYLKTLIIRIFTLGDQKKDSKILARRGLKATQIIVVCMQGF
jgi:hypothetical protein